MSSPRHAPAPGRRTSAPGRPEEAYPHPAGTDGHEHPSGRDGTGPRPRENTREITREGAAWLVSAGSYPRTTLTRWTASPTASLVLPCGTAFDVVSVPVVFGRGVLDQLRDAGPGSGPVATHRGRMLLFAAPGTAHRLPSLLRWEEWGATVGGGHPTVPPLLCHGPGDAVTVPPLIPGTACGPRWMVAPRARKPWLPGPDVLLWACVRAMRAAEGGAVRISIFPGADLGASVYDVSRRR